MTSLQKSALFTTETAPITEIRGNYLPTTHPCHCEPPKAAEQSQVSQKQSEPSRDSRGDCFGGDSGGFGMTLSPPRHDRGRVI
jgi:hypothetical protein